MLLMLLLKLFHLTRARNHIGVGARHTVCVRRSRPMLVVRKNHPQIFVNDYVLYAKIMLDYLRSKGSKV
jgi:hypothetical protein